MSRIMCAILPPKATPHTGSPCGALARDLLFTALHVIYSLLYDTCSAN